MSNKTSTTWLILSHGFNMDGRAASHTITDKIPHLCAAGKVPVIISAHTGRKDIELEHYQLYPLGPVGLRFDLRHVLRQRWGKNWQYRLTTFIITLGLAPGIVIEKLFWPLESQWSWWWPAYRKGLDLIRKGRIELIYSTGGAYSAHIAGAALKQATGLPWIAEIHDPLICPGHTPETQQERMKAHVEALICKYADLPFWFTQQSLTSARQRHPILGERGKVILPGADALKQDLPFYQKSSVLVIAHFGSLSSTRHLGGIISALSLLYNRIPEASTKIELHIYGTHLDSHTVVAMKEHPNVRVRYFGRLEYDAVLEKSGRQKILERMRTADILLLHHGVESACEEYIPSKLYEYLWMQRPILGLVYRNPQLERMLLEMGHFSVPADNIGAQIDTLDTLYHRWRNTGLADNGMTSPYTTAAAVEHLIALVREKIRTLTISDPNMTIGA